MGRVDALAALGHVGEVRIVDALILRRQRRFLSERAGDGRRLALVIAKPSGAAGEDAPAAGAPPLTLQVGIFGLVERPGACDHQQQHRRKRACTDRFTKTHGVLPAIADVSRAADAPRAPSECEYRQRQKDRDERFGAEKSATDQERLVDGTALALQATSEVTSAARSHGRGLRTERRIQSPLIPAALMSGHHFSISALCKAASASGVCCSRGTISCPMSARRARTLASAKAS